MTTGKQTFRQDYIDKIRSDKQNVEKTNQELNHAVHYERAAAAAAAIELDVGAAFVVSASAPFGRFDARPRNGEERRSVVCGVKVRNPPNSYFPDALVVEGSSGLDEAASQGLLFFQDNKTKVEVDLVVITPEYDRYLADTNGRPIRLSIKSEVTMREHNRIVYDGYLAAVIAGGPGALADPTLRARYAVYEEVDMKMPPYLLKESKAKQDKWKAKKRKEWVVRPRVA